MSWERWKSPKTTDAERFCRSSGLHARLFRFGIAFATDRAQVRSIDRQQFDLKIHSTGEKVFRTRRPLRRQRRQGCAASGHALLTHSKDSSRFSSGRCGADNNSAERACGARAMAQNQFRKPQRGRRGAVARLLTVARTCQMQGKLPGLSECGDSVTSKRPVCAVILKTASTT